MRLFKLMLLSALAVSTMSPTPALASNDAEDGGKMICKYRLQTGTRFKTKMCKTAAEWEAVAEANRNGLKEMTDRPQIKVCGPNGCD